nr:hypothetical protein [Tanacetum cinerariifolium]
EAVQIQTDQLQDSLQRENDEFLRNIDKIMKNVLKASASTPSEKATKGAGGSTKGTQSGQQSASKSANVEEPEQTTCLMEETPLPVYETGADDQLIVQTSHHLEWFSQPRKPPSPDRAWNTALPATQGDAHHG